MPSGPHHASSRRRPPERPQGPARPRTWPAVVGVVVVLLALTGVVLASGFSPPGSGAAGPGPRPRRPYGPAPGHPRGRPSRAVRPGARPTTSRPAPTALRTSCRSVAHIGDSTSVDLISPAVLPDPAQRLAAQYADVGVRHLHVDASGGRSIVEEMPGQVNGYDVAQAYWNAGLPGLLGLRPGHQRRRQRRGRLGASA